MCELFRGRAGHGPGSASGQTRRNPLPSPNPSTGLTRFTKSTYYVVHLRSLRYIHERKSSTRERRSSFFTLSTEVVPITRPQVSLVDSPAPRGRVDVRGGAGDVARKCCARQYFVSRRPITHITLDVGGRRKVSLLKELSLVEAVSYRSIEKRAKRVTSRQGAAE